MIDFRFAMKKRADVHEDPKNFVLEFGNPVTLRRTSLAPGCELAGAG